MKIVDSKFYKETNQLQILNLKNGMNSNRIDFSISNHKIEITPYWLLGFSEGEASFSVSLNRGHRFTMNQSAQQENVLLAIKEILILESGLPKESHPELTISFTP